MKTSWSGNSSYAGADSETFTVFVGPKSLVQFKWNGLNCTYGWASLAEYEIRMGIGLQKFLKAELFGINATSLKFSVEFLVLESNKSEKTFEIEEFLAGLEGLQLLRLPDDFDSKINDKFGFVLRYKGDLGYINIEGMNYYEVSEVIETERSVFWNASISVRENIWHKFMMEMSEGQTTAKLCDISGAVLDQITVRKDAEGVKELVIFIANIRDAIVIFKSFHLETYKHIESVNGGDVSRNKFAWSVTYIGFALLTVIAVVGYLLTKKKFTGNRSLQIKIKIESAMHFAHFLST